MKIVHAVLIGTLLSTTAHAHKSNTDKPFEAEIEARHSFMHVVQYNMGILGAMAKGKRDYDPTLASAIAKNIQAAALMSNDSMWPKGSDNGQHALAEETKALPAIWEKYDVFNEKQKDWENASQILVDNAGKSLADLRKGMGAVGKTCKGCHKGFKAK